MAALPGISPQQQYGQGFYVSLSWVPYYRGAKLISNRISIIQFTVNKSEDRKVIITIINVYAPTTKKVSENSTEGDQIYEELNSTLEFYNRHSYLTFIVGDFNSKLGLKQDVRENFMGNYGKGTRNRNRQLLANFLSESQYYATNTTFTHSMRHRSAWYGHIANKHIYNQIDYILIPTGLLRNYTNV